MPEFPSLTGRLLVAMPGIGDARFEHAVILICAHTPDHAMGLRLDRPAPGVDLRDVLAKLDAPAPEDTRHRAVLIGGPVERERGLVLHTREWTAGDSTLSIADDLAMTGTREALSAMTDAVSGPARSVLILGYAGWGQGQLEEELSDNVWLIADADHDLIFDEAHDDKWTRVLAGLGVDASFLSTQAGRA